MFLKRLAFRSKEFTKELKQECANFLGLISYHLIVSKFHNKTHDPKGQENKSLNTFIFICWTISKMAKKGQRLSVSTTSFFLSEFSKFHIWIASIKLSLKSEYEFCSTKVNQDGQRNGRHLLVCTYRHLSHLLPDCCQISHIYYFYQSRA